MLINMKNIFTANPILKVNSLVLGAFIWYITSQHQALHVQVKAPVCLENISDHHTINIPDEITLQISGNRSDLEHIDYSNLALHVNAQELNEGTNFIAITHEKLFLPQSIKLINYSPLVVKALVTSTQAKDFIPCSA